MRSAGPESGCVVAMRPRAEDHAKSCGPALAAAAGGLHLDFDELTSGALQALMADRVTADALAAVERLATEGQREVLAALEAHADPRIELVPTGASRMLLEREGLLALPAEEVRAALAQLTADETIEWASQTVTWGAVLSRFASHCRDELDDVDVVEEDRARLVARWRRETSLLELRTGFVECARLATETPTMLLGDIDRDLDSLVEAFAS